MSLINNAYERDDDWETKVLGDERTSIEKDERKHRLYFACDIIELWPFNIIGKVNSDVFLEVEPGLLCCVGVYVSITFLKTGPGIGDLASFNQLRFDFIEHASQKFNEIFAFPTQQDMDAGKATRLQMTLYQQLAMSSFFGNDSFPLKKFR